jgi:hypothetical protein
MPHQGAGRFAHTRYAWFPDRRLISRQGHPNGRGEVPWFEPSKQHPQRQEVTTCDPTLSYDLLASLPAKS